MPSKTGPRLSQATKQQMRDEKAAAKASELAAERQRIQEQRVEQLHKSRTTPSWLQAHRNTFSRLKAALEEEGYDESLLARCAFHEEQLSRISRAFEQQSVAPSGVEALKEILDYFLEMPCGPRDIIERFEHFEDAALYEEEVSITPSTSCSPEANKRLASWPGS